MRAMLGTLAIGVAAGVAASLAMNLFQGAAAPLFGQDQGDDDPATVKAADTATRATAGEPVPQRYRERAGGAVHYATGAALGAGYALLARRWPAARAGYGTAFGAATAVVLDYVVVPAFGWGPPAWKTPAATHAYGLASHLVFGAALEGGRRAGGLAAG